MDEVRNTPEERNAALYRYVSPKRPAIRRLGTILCDMVETTPVVFGGRLYRFEYVRAGELNEANPSKDSYFHFVDVETSRKTAPFGVNCTFGAAFADGEVMYVTGTDTEGEDHVVRVFRSEDLETWEEYGKLTLPEGMSGYNTGVTKKDGVYILLIEVDKPLYFRFRFARSTDMKNWTLLPEEHRFHEEPRYAGGPALYSLPGDPYYYVFYLEAYPGPSYATCVARSRDLIHWTYSPINPVLMYDEAEDKKIGSPFLTVHEQERIARALDINNSDLELCEFNGRTILYYSWGNQHGIEFLAEAAYEGTMSDFIHGYFEKEE